MAAMNKGRHWKGIAVLATIIMMAAGAFGMFAYWHHSLKATLIYPRKIQVSASTKRKALEAGNLALERYQFVKRPRVKSQRFDSRNDRTRKYSVLFPIGRSDRIYLFFEGDFYSGSPTGNAILCYQHIHGEDLLVYQVNLKDLENGPANDWRTQRPLRDKSLLDFVTRDQGYALPKEISALAKKDLARKQDYVQYTYTYTILNDTLEAWLLSNLKYGDPPDNHQDVGHDTDIDPITKQSLLPDEFFRIYGLPVLPQERRELALRKMEQRLRSKARGRRIALERYRFLNRLAPQFGQLPIWQQPGDSTAAKIALFPIGRSDRTYLFIRGDADQETQMYCYQWKKGKEKLVYKIQMVVQRRPATKMMRLRNLLDFVRSEGSNNNFDGKEYDFSYTLPAGTSQFAKVDLAMPGDYAEYGYLPIGGSLFVELFSQYHNGDFPENPDDEYNVNEDPVTNKFLKEGQFYKKYGLPVAQEELPKIR